jgi:pimeloyl-ACP methyl ester carboxylesterase
MTDRLRTRSFGPTRSSEPPIVTLPGLGVSRYLRAACHGLADRSGRRVLLVDPPGFGTNARALTGGATVSSVAERLRSWMSPLGPVLLLGQSTGCLLAARLAVARAGLDVRALALVGPVFDPTSATVARGGARLVVDGRSEPWWLAPSQLPEWVRNARALPGYVRSCLAESLEDDLASVGCPVVVVRGDRDPLSRHEWAARLADRPGRTLVVVPGGGHTYMAGRPAALADSLATGRFGETVTP